MFMGIKAILKEFKKRQDAEAQKSLVYSQNEIDTGKIWIDGKKIYRKVIKQKITTYNIFVSIGDFDTSIIDSLTTFNGSITQPNGKKTPISYFMNDNDGVFICLAKEHNRFQIFARQNGIGDVILIIEYTKITN